MTSTNSNSSLSEGDGGDKAETGIKTNSLEEKESDKSATTPDKPDFGWSSYAERLNGRFAMIGFTALLIIEAISHKTFIDWSGIG